MKDGDFVGQGEVDGFDTYSWKKVGLSTNYYYETTFEVLGDRVPIKIDEGGSHLHHFNQSSFFPAVAPGIFDVPKSCTKDKVCPKASLCTAMRPAGYEDEIELVQ